MHDASTLIFPDAHVSLLHLLISVTDDPLHDTVVLLCRYSCNIAISDDK